MCDTLYRKTPDGYIFGKTATAVERAEPRPLLPAAETSGKTLKCTYIEVEQVPETYALYLVKPS